MCVSITWLCSRPDPNRKRNTLRIWGEGWVILQHFKSWYRHWPLPLFSLLPVDTPVSVTRINMLPGTPPFRLQCESVTPIKSLPMFLLPHRAHHKNHENQEFLWVCNYISDCCMGFISLHVRHLRGMLAGWDDSFQWWWVGSAMDRSGSLGRTKFLACLLIFCFSSIFSVSQRCFRSFLRKKNQ